MAKLSSFNRPEGDPQPTVEQTENVAPPETAESITEEKKLETPKATFTINPPRFQPKVQLTPEQEYEEVLKEIEEGKQKGKSSVIIKHDLQDLAWQKLSQAGYKIQRKVMDRTGIQQGYVGDKDPNKIEFEINLKEFNRTDI